MKIAVIAFTRSGLQLGRRIQRVLAGDAVTLAAGTGPDKVSLRRWVEEHFYADEALIFVGASGIAVRAVAPHLKSKTTDPAVLVLDDKGRFCISLITTATDNHGVFAIDTWAKGQNLAIVNPEAIKRVSARLLAGETIRLASDFPIAGSVPDGVLLVRDKPYDVAVTLKPRMARDTLYLVPKIAAVGVGCRKNIAPEALEEAYEMLLKKGGVDPRAVLGFFSIDMKRDEPGLLQFCQSHGLPLTTYSAAELNAVKGSFSASAFVQKTTGTDNVCERSAVLGSGGGKLNLKKNAGNGVTMAMALRNIAITFDPQ